MLVNAARGRNVFDFNVLHRHGGALGVIPLGNFGRLVRFTAIAGAAVADSHSVLRSKKARMQNVAGRKVDGANAATS